MSQQKVVEPNSISMNPEAQTLSVPSLHVRSSTMGWLIWGVSAVFVLFQFFLQLSSGEIVDGLMQSFSLSAFGGGILVSVYYIYVALQLPAGILVDRFGSRRLLSIGALICGLGCLIFAKADGVIIAGMGRLLMGFGASFAFVGSLNLIGKWFPPQRFGIMVGIAETIGMLGTIVGGFFFAKLIQNYGWRHSMMVAAMVGVVIALLIMLIVRNAPKSSTSLASQNTSHFWIDLRLLLKNKLIWVNGIYSGLMFAVATVFVALWSIPFFMVAHRISMSEAVLAADMVFAGIAIGSPLLGWLDGNRLYHCRSKIFTGCALLSAILMSLVIYLTMLPMWVVFVLMLLLGLCACSYILTFAVANELVLPHMRAASLGFVNTLSVGTAPILQPLLGFILKLTLVGSVTGGLMQYSVFSYQVALSLLPILLLVAAWLGRYIPSLR